MIGGRVEGQKAEGKRGQLIPGAKSPRAPLGLRGTMGPVHGTWHQVCAQEILFKGNSD